jgi:hypothetical protein
LSLGANILLFQASPLLARRHRRHGHTRIHDPGDSSRLAHARRASNRTRRTGASPAVLRASSARRASSRHAKRRYLWL